MPSPVTIVTKNNLAGAGWIVLYSSCFTMGDRTCHHGQPVKVFLCMKEGRHYGHQIAVCQNSIGKCNFFRDLGLPVPPMLLPPPPQNPHVHQQLYQYQHDQYQYQQQPQQPQLPQLPPVALLPALKAAATAYGATAISNRSTADVMAILRDHSGKSDVDITDALRVFFINFVFFVCMHLMPFVNPTGHHNVNVGGRLSYPPASVCASGGGSSAHGGTAEEAQGGGSDGRAEE